ncbi:hypothetical protein [Clostridium sp. C8-1-8]|uniref:hypothetical protein n=1 Tax=Clostridium sp. C8-1-8 TaxID=2698831 RepID=UPI001371A065|nr:hypothetical protein [Clostridium sp. C8-1-8]
MSFNSIQAEIYSYLAGINENIQADEIKSSNENNDFDYVNNIGMFYSMPSVIDTEYKDTIPLTINLVSAKENKIAIQDLANTFDTGLNKVKLEHCRIVRQNSYFSSFIDDMNLNNIVLSYYIYKF